MQYNWLIPSMRLQVIQGRFPFVWKNRGEFSALRNRTNFLNQNMERDECAPFETFFSSQETGYYSFRITNMAAVFSIITS